MLTPPTVLVLTHRRDIYTVDRVIAALEARGARPVRVDTDRFPGELRLSAVDEDGRVRYLFDDGEQTLADGDVRAAWLRNLWTPAVAAEVAPEFRSHCIVHSQTLLLGWLDGLAVPRWINHPRQVLESENKVFQHRWARAAGLKLPATLITNDPERVRRFFDEVGGRMVTKVLGSLSKSMDRSGRFVPTSDVSREDLEALDSLRFGPMIFQEKVEKALELRVQYVAGQAFVGAVDARRSARGGTDWRLAEAAEVRWQPATLPPEVLRKLDRLMSSLGLLAGAADVIVTPEGEHVFLEVNAVGEWGMLERDLGLPISKAFADALLAEGSQ